MSFITIPGFKKMSKQRIFNMAVSLISTTRKQSYRQAHGCLYSGSGCNAAPLIEKDKRAKADRVGGWRDLVATGMVPGNNAQFIEELQAAHDSCGHNEPNAFMGYWKENMAALAKRWNLSTSTLDKVPA